MSPSTQPDGNRIVEYTDGRQSNIFQPGYTPPPEPASKWSREGMLNRANDATWTQIWGAGIMAVSVGVALGVIATSIPLNAQAETKAEQCATALESGDRIQGLMGQGLQMASTGIDAAATGDSLTAQVVTSEVAKLSAKLSTEQTIYNTSKGQCNE